MTLFYIGNMQSKTPTTIDTLTPLLRPVVKIRAASKFKNKLIRLVDMAWAVSRARPKDLVLIDVYSSSAFYFAWLCGKVSRLRKVKYIAYVHGGNLAQRIDNNPNWKNRFFSDSSLIIAPSKFLHKAIEDRGYGPVKYIPNSIRVENYPFKSRSFVRPKLLWVRSFAKAYNPQMAIKVLAEISKWFPEAELCMVGPDKGNKEECIAFAASLGLLNRIQFTGMLTQIEWIEKSKEYDLFINTTNFDNTPVSVIEAMALGMPVISTNVGGIPFLLTDKINCLLVEKNDHVAMCNAIKSLMERPKSAISIANSARKTAEQFDWQKVKKLWIEVLNKETYV